MTAARDTNAIEWFRNRYMVVERIAAGVVRLSRTSEPYPSMADMTLSFEQVIGAFSGIDRTRYRVLMDLREGPMRNDPEFETTLRPLRDRLFADFDRIAILVRTSVGKLQISRQTRQNEVSQRAAVFDDENAAAAFIAKK